MHRKCFLDNTKAKNFLNENLTMFFFGRKRLTFGICKKCGLIYQTNTVKPKEMKKYYDTLSVAYDNLNKPTKDKIKSVNRHINIVRDELKIFPKLVLEVSSLNTYNLRQFKKNGATVVEGLEPSKIIAQGINKKEKIKIYNTTIEKFNFKKKYNLIILTHVLEHLYNPLLALKKCFKSQKANQHVLLEVPLFDKVENYPNGTFFLEHLNYFSENNFLSLIEKSGYKTIFISKMYESTVLPFITIIAKKENNKKNTYTNTSPNFSKQSKWFDDFKGFKNLRIRNFKRRIKKNVDFFNQTQNIKNYLKRNELLWDAVDKKIDKFNKKRPVYIYGAGFHASQFLYYTQVEKKFNVIGFIDSSEAKKNRLLGNYKILNPNSEKINKNANIIICSNYSERIIYKSLKIFRDKGMETYNLYN